MVEEVVDHHNEQKLQGKAIVHVSQDYFLAIVELFGDKPSQKWPFLVEDISRDEGEEGRGFCEDELVEAEYELVFAVLRKFSPQV